MVTERLTGADSTGEGGGRSAMLPAPILRVRIVAVVAAMAVQMAGGTRGIGGLGQPHGLAAAEFRRVGIAVAPGSITGGGLARRPQVHDLA